MTPTEPEEAKGQLTLPLTSSAPDGTSYRLVGASFEITGPQTVLLTDTSADTVQTALVAGNYTVRLLGSWHLERVDAPGKVVLTQLISPNPLAFTVTRGLVTEVRFLFKLSAGADVGFEVDSGGWLTGTFRFNVVEVNGPPSVFIELLGKSVPFVISYKTYTLDKSEPGKVRVRTGPIHVQFGGPPTYAVLDRVSKDLEGQTLVYSLQASGGAVSFEGTDLPGAKTFALRLLPTPVVPGAVDADGYPIMDPFPFTSEFALNDTTRFADRVRGYVEITGSN